MGTFSSSTSNQYTFNIILYFDTGCTREKKEAIYIYMYFLSGTIFSLMSALRHSPKIFSTLQDVTG